MGRLQGFVAFVAISAGSLVAPTFVFATGTAIPDDPGNSAVATITRTDCANAQSIRVQIRSHPVIDIVFGDFTGSAGAGSIAVDFSDVYQADEVLPGTTQFLWVYCSLEPVEAQTLDCYDVTFAPTLPPAITSITATQADCAVPPREGDVLPPSGSRSVSTLWLASVALLTGLALTRVSTRGRVRGVSRA